jgi:hypothetical protein
MPKQDAMPIVEEYLVIFEYQAKRAGVTNYSKISELLTQLRARQIRTLAQRLQKLRTIHDSICALFCAPGATAIMWDNMDLFHDPPIHKEHREMKRLQEKLKKHLDTIIKRLEVVTSGAATIEEAEQPGSEDTEGVD